MWLEPNVHFGVLGSVEVRFNGSVRYIGPPKQRAAFALLILRANELVTHDALVDELWNDSPPRSAAGNIRSYISGIRAAFPAGERARILSQRTGYMLSVEAGEVDVSQFRNAALAGRTALKRGDREMAIAQFERSLATWRGEVCEDVPAGVVSGPIRTSLAEQRIAIQQDCLAARIDRGETLELVDDVQALVATAPLNERSWALLMTAKSRGGDVAGALRAFDDARAVLAEELGIEPGPELRELHHAALTGMTHAIGQRFASTPDREIHRPTPAATRGLSMTELPPEASPFVGRAAELAALDEMARRLAPRLVVLDGMAGVGKTALAVRWSAQAGSSDLDGRLYLDLRGFGPSAPLTPCQALESALHAIGIRPELVPPDLDGRSALWRAALASRRALVVLDNARNSEQVRPLLAHTAGMVVVTSRNQLRGLVARDGAARLTVPTLSDDESVALLARLLRADPGQLRDLALLCAGLPLALRIAAERVQHMPARQVADVCELLRDPRTCVGALSLADDPATDLAEVFSWSYDLLDAETARVLRSLARHPGRPGVPVTASKIDLTGVQLRAGLDRLAIGHLLEDRGTGGYHLHRLVQMYAAGRAEPAHPVPFRPDVHGVNQKCAG